MTLEAEPEEKIFSLIYAHLDIIREAVARNGTLRAEFFRNIWMVEKVRKAFDEEEHRLLVQLLQEGVDQGRFHIENVGLMADLMHPSVTGIEVPHINDRQGDGLEDDEHSVMVHGQIKQVLNVQLKDEKHPDTCIL